MASSRQYKIIQLNTLDQGGAARATLNLNGLFKKSEHQSKVVVFNKTTAHEDVIQVRRPKLSQWQARVQNKLHYMQHKEHLDNNKYFFRYNQNHNAVSVEDIIAVMPYQPDFIILQWIAEFITPKLVYQLQQKTGAKIIWYMQDESPLTGGCHYSFGCKRYHSECGKCPAIKSDEENDASRKQMLQKLQYLGQTDITLVLHSSEQRKDALQTQLYGQKEVVQINNTLDETIFKPGSQSEARERLGLPLDKTIFFFGTLTINEERKGFKYLKEATEILKERLQNEPELLDKALMLIVAKYDSGIDDLAIPVQHFDIFRDDNRLADIYRAVEAYVCTSTEDLGPMMLSEAMLCGTSVISFNIGIATDMVITGETGYKAENYISEQIAEGMEQLLRMSEEDKQALSKRASKMGYDMHHPDSNAVKWQQLFESLSA